MILRSGLSAAAPLSEKNQSSPSSTQKLFYRFMDSSSSSKHYKHKSTGGSPHKSVQKSPKPLVVFNEGAVNCDLKDGFSTSKFN
jgi:hypothetical protein